MMNRTYVEKLPDGIYEILPDRVLVVSDKQAEEVTDEHGNTYMRYSYVIVDTISIEAHAHIQNNNISTLQDAVLEAVDLFIGGL